MINWILRWYFISLFSKQLYLILILNETYKGCIYTFVTSVSLEITNKNFFQIKRFNESYIESNCKNENENIFFNVNTFFNL